jgi:hypothetical protein
LDEGEETLDFVGVGATGGRAGLQGKPEQDKGGAANGVIDSRRGAGTQGQGGLIHGHENSTEAVKPEGAIACKTFNLKG